MVYSVVVYSVVVYSVVVHSEVVHSEVTKNKKSLFPEGSEGCFLFFWQNIILFA